MYEPTGIRQSNRPVRAERAESPEKTDGANTRPPETATVPYTRVPALPRQTTRPLRASSAITRPA